MGLPPEIRTDRLLLRRWLPADREPFAALNTDPRVVGHLPAALSRQASDALAARIEAHFDHPALPAGHSLRRHVLYRIARASAPDRPDAVRIRLADRADIPFLREMLFEAAFWRAGSPRPALDEAFARPELAKLIEAWGRPGDTAVIAETLLGVGVGAAWIRFWSSENHSYGFVAPDVPELGLAVRSDFRRQGVGSRLLRALLEQAAEKRIRRVSLSVEIENPALRLYQRMGFHRVGRVGGAWTLIVEVPHSDVG